MLVLITCLLVTLTSSQNTINVDTAASQFWGTIPISSPSPNVTTHSSKVEREAKSQPPTIALPVKPTSSDVNCQCVPYNLCNSSYHGFKVNNPEITGSGKLDPRGGEYNECPIRGEFCCVVPPPKRLPDSIKLKGCGHRNPNGFGATLANYSTKFGEFPWVVALLDAENRTYVGVGVLIHPEVALTVAHVAVHHTATGLRVRAGEWDLRNTNELYYHDEQKVKEIFIHNKFDNLSFINDIALLRMEHPFNLTEHINIICLPEQGRISSVDCLANGWGKDKFGPEGLLSPIMKKVDLMKTQSDVCSEALSKTVLGPAFTLDSSFICAVGAKGEDMCQGDGGGPLVCPRFATNTYELNGLVSYGVGCGQENLPAVYTNVEYFTDWIRYKFKSWGLDIQDAYEKLDEVIVY